MSVLGRNLELLSNCPDPTLSERADILKQRLPEASCSQLGKLVGAIPPADRLDRKLISIQTASEKRIRPADHGVTANDKREIHPWFSGSLFPFIHTSEN